jgi:hypothetical protein
MRKFTVLLIDQRTINAHLGEFILRCACATRIKAAILDIDAFYASTTEQFVERLPERCLNDVTLHVPDLNKDIGRWVVEQFLRKNEERLFLIDNLNSLYHLLSADDSESTNRRLTLMISFLSFISRTNDFSTVSILYREGAPTERSLVGSRSLMRAGDMTAYVTVQDGEIRFRNIRGNAWNKTFAAAL